ncbi:MAG: HlyD family secretion protein [Geminicoccaceae bacterium]
MEEQSRGRRWVWIVLVLCVLIFGYNLIADRLTPYTADAMVQAYVVGIAPEVAGNIVSVQVKDNMRVKQGDVLFAIDREFYEAELASAEAEVAQAEAAAELADVTMGRLQQAGRAVSQAENDEAAAEVRRARAEIQLRQAVLDQARLDLGRTTLIAPSDGTITNLRLTTGQYASVGQPVMTFVDVGAAWIDANFRENNLGNMKPGDPAEIAIDLWPGMIFPGTVESIAWGVSTGEETSAAGLPTIRTPTGWLREAQRFPVRIVFAGEFPRGTRLGSQVNIIVYTSGNPVINALAWLWIRIVTWLSYVY